MPATEPPRVYGNWRAPQSAGLPGLGTAGTIGLFVSLAVVLIVFGVGGIVAGLIALLLVGLAALVTITKDKHGVSIARRVTRRFAWGYTKTVRANEYRSGPLSPVPWGTTMLPGIGASLTLSEHHDSYDRPFALIHCPAQATFTVVLQSEPDGAALVDREQVDQLVGSWGWFLANLGSEAGVIAASVTIETAPDTGAALQRQVQRRIDPNSSAFAQDVLSEVVETYPLSSATSKAFVAITFASAARRGSRRRQADEMGRDLASRLSGLTMGLQQSGAGVSSPMSAQQLCELVKVAYNPAYARIIDDCRADGETPDLRWTDAGPASAHATWDSYRHDSAISCTWAMTEAPRGNVQSSILTRLLAPSSDITRKRVTLLYKPFDPGQSAKIVEKDLSAATSRAMGGDTRAKARDKLAVAKGEATAAEEAAGAGLVEFSMLVTATVTDKAQLPDAVAAIDNLASTARLQLCPVYGSQDSAFSACLPLGLALPELIKSSYRL